MPQTAKTTPVPASVSPVTLSAGGNGNLGTTIYYDGAATLYLLEGEGMPSDTSFTYKLGANSFLVYERPSRFTGKVQGIWSAATGVAMVTERT